MLDKSVEQCEHKVIKIKKPPYRSEDIVYVCIKCEREFKDFIGTLATVKDAVRFFNE